MALIVPTLTERGPPPRAVLLILALLAFFALPAPALATTPVPRVSDGPGIKVGQRSTFHPGFGLGIGVDSNVFFEDKVTDPMAPNGGEKPNPAAFIIPTAWMSLGNRQVRDGLLMSPAERSGRLADYNIGLIAGFRQFMAKQSNLKRQSRFSMGVSAHVMFLPGRRFSIQLDEDLWRLSEPRNLEMPAEFNFNRIDHNGALTFIGRPGGGRLQLAFGYISQLLYFENRDVDTRRLNRVVNGGYHETKWRFLPKSSLLLRYSLAHSYHFSCCLEVGTGRNEDNFSHRLIGGFRGQVGKKVVLEALAGWGWAFYRDDPNGPDFNSFIGQAQVEYYPTLRTRLQLGFERSFADSLFGNYWIDLGGRFALAHTFRWRMLATLGTGVFDRQFKGLPAGTTQPIVEWNEIVGYAGKGSASLSRRDLVFTLGVKLEQPIGRFVVLGLSYDLSVIDTDHVTFFCARDPPELCSENLPASEIFRDYAGYVRHFALLFSAVRF